MSYAEALDKLEELVIRDEREWDLLCKARDENRALETKVEDLTLNLEIAKADYINWRAGTIIMTCAALGLAAGWTIASFV